MHKIDPTNMSVLKELQIISAIQTLLLGEKAELDIFNSISHWKASKSAFLRN